MVPSGAAPCLLTNRFRAAVPCKARTAFECVVTAAAWCRVSSSGRITTG